MNEHNNMYWENEPVLPPTQYANDSGQEAYFVDEGGYQYSSIPIAYFDDGLGGGYNAYAVDDHQATSAYIPQHSPHPQYGYEEEQYHYGHEYPVSSYNQPYSYPQTYVDHRYSSPLLRGRGILIASFIGISMGLLLYLIGQPALVETSDAMSMSHEVEPKHQDSTNTIVGSSGVLPQWLMPSVLYWEELILVTATTHGLDPLMLAIVMQVESCGDPRATSVAGATGLFQVMPFHFERGEDMYDPNTNAMRGAKYLVTGITYHTGKGFRGDDILFRTFAGYNGGHGSVLGSYSYWAYETQRYYIWTTGLWEDAQSGVQESETLTAWLAAGGISLCQSAESRLGI